MNMKSFLIIGAVAMATVASSYADLTVKMTGSTAFRSALHASIRAALGAGYKASYASADSSGKDSAAIATFQNTISGYGVVTVQCHWLGSGDGCDAACTTGKTTTFIPTGSLPVSGGNYLTASPTTESGVATVGLSDIYASSASAAATGGNVHVLRGYSDTACDDAQVGVIQFQFVVNKKGHDLGISNITAQQARTLFGNGIIVGTGFGVGSNYVYLTGRNADSGTRATVVAETGYGLSDKVNQYVWNGSSLVAASPADSGDSAANTAAWLNNTAITSSLIGYLGNADAATAIAGGNGTILTYNGVANTDANIENGVYTLWSYEHLMTQTGARTNNVNKFGDFLDLLTTKIPANLGTAGIPLTSMTASRAGDGALVGW